MNWLTFSLGLITGIIICGCAFITYVSWLFNIYPWQKAFWFGTKK